MQTQFSTLLLCKSGWFTVFIALYDKKFLYIVFVVYCVISLFWYNLIFSTVVVFDTILYILKFFVHDMQKI